MNKTLQILKRDSLNEGGFAGLKEHRLVSANILAENLFGQSNEYYISIER